METEECVFCARIQAGLFDFETAYAVTFEPLNPVAPGHRLFLPKSHIRDAAEAPDLAGEVFKMASSFAATTAQDFNLITSKGVSATQSVFHMHVHYVPRFPGDDLLLPWSTPGV